MIHLRPTDDFLLMFSHLRSGSADYAILLTPLMVLFLSMMSTPSSLGHLCNVMGLMLFDEPWAHSGVAQVPCWAPFPHCPRPYRPSLPSSGAIAFLLCLLRGERNPRHPSWGVSYQWQRTSGRARLRIQDGRGEKQQR